MGVYSKTQSQLRQSVAYSLDDIVTGTCLANSTNTVALCTTLVDANDYYNDWWMHIFAGINVGESRRVTDFVSATNITLAPAFTAALTANSQFELHNKFSIEQYNDAINRSIEVGKDEYLIDKKDETLTLTTDVYEYALANLSMRYIHAIYLEDSTDANTYYVSSLIDNRCWDIIVNGTTPYLKFDDDTFPIGAAIASQKLRVLGQATQAVLSNNSDTCVLPPEFIIQQARAILLDQMKGYEQQADRAQAKALVERRRMVMAPHDFSKSLYEV